MKNKLNIKLKGYQEQLEEWPKEGHHIMAQYDTKQIIVYQSYRPEIGTFAVENQYFGGAFSLGRMTWIKPNFLWMMYRNGWGTKEGQEIVLAIHLKREAFERYLRKSVYSSYQSDIYSSREEWRETIEGSSVRLQWDPDHDIYGQNVERRAIQIGVRNEEIVQYAKEDILQIEDISHFVKEQHQLIKEGKIDELVVPEEKPFLINDQELNQKLRLSHETA